MQILVGGAASADDAPALRAMYIARKEVFVDLLEWDVPVLDGRYEIDQFDDPSATYVIVLGDDGCHRASARLLPTMRPHILDTLFPDLCESAVPRSPLTFEITRFCLDRHQNAVKRREARNLLITAIADFARDARISTYTGVAELSWFQQILSFGWRCRALGLPRAHGRSTLVALQIDIDASTPDRLSDAGVYTPVVLELLFDASLKEVA
jgi:N-acyl-L-homoserine lactone synthetase